MKRALAALVGVGDPQLGQWTERGKIATHVRRRLTPDEASHVNALRDIRGTPEERNRLNAIALVVPHLERFIFERIRR